MNADSEQTALARQWLQYAKGDLASAKLLAVSPDLPPRNACYLAQQCAEKALKAVLIAINIELIRTHDLDALVQRMPEKWKDKFADYDLSWLSEWGVEARYPGDWPEATAEEAARAVEMAENL